MTLLNWLGLRVRGRAARRPRAGKLLHTVLEDRSCPSGFTVVATGLNNPAA